MYRTSLRPDAQAWPVSNTVMPVFLLAGNLLFNIVANAGFKLSAASPT